MNEFKKDELIKLKNGLEYLPNSVSISKKYWEECEEILRKIQCMIENYCEHNDRQYYEHVPVYECNKCHMVSMI